MCSLTDNAPTSIVERLNKINVEDLEYVERDLCFYQLVSISFLLYGEDRTNAEFLLQKLIVLSKSISTKNINADLLKNFANINENWRSYLIEALGIIGAKKVLRKLGFKWEEIRQHYLPHIAELSLHVHPLLKSLYKICERLTVAQSGRLALDINEQHKRPDNHLRFYDFEYLEIFLLDWITHRIINLGDHELDGVNVRVLLDFFKLNDLDTLKMLLQSTIECNKEQNKATLSIDQSDANGKIRYATKPSSRLLNKFHEIDQDECYSVSRENAGYCLIINQENFYLETDERFQHILPKKNFETRHGTNSDRDRLKAVFSSFHYMIEEHNNLTNVQILHSVREIVKRSLLCDSLIVCILSHGCEGFIYGSNSVPVEISDIERIITGETLHGKPKMLIIQACQTKVSIPTGAVRNDLPPSANAYANMMKAMSTVKGYWSWRHSKTGSWFIKTLCDEVDAHGDKKHMLDILISVTKRVTNMRGDHNEVMVPITSHTMTKYFFLPNRITNPNCIEIR